MSKTTKSTPGAWQAMKGTDDDPDRWCVVTEITGFLIAEIHNGAPGDTLETEGVNAHLMAASSEMYEALKLAEIWLCNCVPIGEPAEERPLPKIRAAMAKAEGRS